MKFKILNSAIALLILSVPTSVAAQSNCESVSLEQASTVLLHAMNEINLSGFSFDGLNVRSVCKKLEAMETRAYREIATYNFEFIDDFGYEAATRLLITNWSSYSRDSSYTVKLEKTHAERQGHPM